MNNNDTESAQSDSVAESVSDEHYHDSVEDRTNDSVEDSDVEDKTTDGKNRSRPDFVLDLRNVPSIINIVKFDDETSEKLSAVREQPEEEHRMPETTFIETENHESPDKILLERIRVLRDIITTLWKHIRQEVTLWRKERGEYQLLRERRDIHALEEATSAARTAVEAYAAESPLSTELGDVADLNPVPSRSELTILEYEKKMARYQDSLALERAEKRYNMRRQLIANTYRQRLVEVERLCNQELESVRRSASTLQPLRRMASQWCIDEDGKYDPLILELNRVGMPYKYGSNLLDILAYDRSRVCKTGTIAAEVDIVPESVAARFSSAEFAKDERHFIIKKAKTSQIHILAGSNSLPSNSCASTSNY